MKKFLIPIQLIILSTFLSGCLYPNETGVSKWYYNDCKEYYDVAGRYHKECDNLFDYNGLSPFKSNQTSQNNNCEFGDCITW